MTLLLSEKRNLYLVKKNLFLPNYLPIIGIVLKVDKNYPMQKTKILIRLHFQSVIWTKVSGRWLQVLDCLCRYSVTCASSPTRLIPSFSKLREILTLLCCITLSSSREKPTQAQEVAVQPSTDLTRHDRKKA